MIFGKLYKMGYIKQKSLALDLWINLAKQNWYQIFHIPYHFFTGLFYGYTPNEINAFCFERR